MAMSDVRKIHYRKLQSSHNGDMEVRFRRKFPNAEIIDKARVAQQSFEKEYNPKKYYQYFQFYKEKR
jgi:hypothetical protein